MEPASIYTRAFKCFGECAGPSTSGGRRMSDPEHSPHWKTSSFTHTGDCVEWKVEEDQVLVRNSKRPSEAQISFTRSEWTAFILGVKAGEADI